MRCQLLATGMMLLALAGCGRQQKPNLALGVGLTPQQTAEVERAMQDAKAQAEKAAVAGREHDAAVAAIREKIDKARAQYAADLEAQFLRRGIDVHVSVSDDGRTLSIFGPAAKRPFGYQLLADPLIRSALRRSGFKDLMWGEGMFSAHTLPI